MTQTYSPADTASHDPVDPTAVMGRRIFAWIIDVAIIAAIVSAFVAVRAVTQADTIDFATNAEAEAHCDTLIDQGRSASSRAPMSSSSISADRPSYCSGWPCRWS